MEAQWNEDLGIVESADGKLLSWRPEGAFNSFNMVQNSTTGSLPVAIGLEGALAGGEVGASLLIGG